MPAVPFPRTHQRRLREVYRSAGWPCQDLIEVELLAAGLLERVRSAAGHETVRVTDAGLAAIAASLRVNRASRDPHEALVERVAREMTRAGRLAWRGLSLRAKVDEAWTMAMPDVFSVRHTTVEAFLEPVVHEIKVRRADLLVDLKREGKRAAYLQLASQCWYVIREGIADPAEIPPECGVLLARDGALEVARAAPRRAMLPSFDLWMALARATPMDGWRAEEAQLHLGHLEHLGPQGHEKPLGPAGADDAALTGPAPDAVPRAESPDTPGGDASPGRSADNAPGGAPRLAPPDLFG